MKQQNMNRLLTILMPIFYVIQAPKMYLTGFAATRGVPDGLLSTLIGFSFLAAFAGQYFWGYLADRIQSNKKIFTIGIILSMVDYMILWFIPGSASFAITFILLGIFLSPQGSILDAWTLDLIHYEGKIYGKIRSIGAAGMALAMLVLGFLITEVGYIVILVTVLASGLLTLFLAAQLPDRQAVHTNDEKPQGMGALLKNGSFIYILLLVFLLGTVLAPPNNLKILLVRAAGGTEANMGVDNFIGLGVQAAFYYTAGHMNMRRSHIILPLSICATLLGAGLLINAQSIYMVYLSTALIYGAFSYENTIVRFIAQKITPPEYRTLAISMIDASFIQMGGVVGMYGAGWLLNHTGLTMVMQICTGICVAALVISLFSKKTAVQKEV